MEQPSYLGTMPVYVDDILYIGDGPVIGVGNQPSEAYWNQREMVSGAPSIQWSVTYKAPVPPKLIAAYDLARVPLYPGTDYGTAVVMAPAPTPSIGTFQDIYAPLANNDPDLIELGAPSIPT